MKIWSYSALAAYHFLRNPEVQRHRMNRSEFYYGDTDKPHYSSDDFTKLFFIPRRCPYCKAECIRLGTFDNAKREGFDHSHVTAQLFVCLACGWWTIPAITNGEALDTELMWARVGQVRGELALLKTDGLALPIQELRRFLLANYGARLYVNPRRIEEVVGDIFRSLGFYVMLAPQTRGDQGIDLLVLAAQDGTRIGVQVKRTKNKIGVELIRSFAGALLLGGITRGVFVTTNDYTLGARKTTAKYATQRGYKIELIDAGKFYEALGLSLRPAYSDDQDASSPFAVVWRNPESICTTSLGSMTRIDI